MDRATTSRSSMLSTSNSGTRIKEEPVLPSQDQREDAALGADVSFPPGAPGYPFTLGNAPWTFGDGFSDSNFQLVEPPEKLDWLSLSQVTWGGSELDPTPSSTSSRRHRGVGAGVLQQTNASHFHGQEGIVRHLHPSPDAGGGQDAFRTSHSWNAVQAGFGDGISDSHFQQLEPPERLDWPSLGHVASGSSEVNSIPASSSSRGLQGVGAGVLQEANASPFHGQEAIGDPLHPNPDAGGGFHTRVGNASSVSYDLMRQAALSMPQPRNVNYGQEYPTANYSYAPGVGGRAFSSRKLPFPFQFHGRMASPSTPLASNQAAVLGFSQYVRTRLASPSSMNVHGTAQTASHGMHRYNARIRRNMSPPLLTMAPPPGFPGTDVPRTQYQPVNIGQSQGSHQVRPHANSVSNFPGQLPAAVVELSPSSNVHGQVRKRSNEEYPPVNIDVNRRRILPMPYLVIPPPVQGEAGGPLTQAQVVPSLSHFGQAPRAFPVPIQAARPVLLSTQSIQPRQPTQARRGRPPLARVQRSSAAATSQQRVVRKVTPKQQQKAGLSSTPFSASGSAIPPSALPLQHIQWKGPEGHHQLVGESCFVCRRDLSYPPEGPIVENSFPRVSVLPCQHSFHTSCLELITPPDQDEDPPCLPCALNP